MKCVWVWEIRGRLIKRAWFLVHGWWRSGNSQKNNNPRYYKFCPYCGKEIEVKEGREWLIKESEKWLKEFGDG